MEATYSFIRRHPGTFSAGPQASKSESVTILPSRRYNPVQFFRTALLLKVCFVFVVGCSACIGILRADDLSPYEQILSKNNVNYSAEGLKTYLQGLIPDKNEQARQLRLVKQLGSDDFFEREQAMQTLSALRTHPTELLVKAMQGNDAEVSWRAKVVLDRYHAGNVSILNAVLTTISQKKYTGMIAELLDVIPVLDKDYLRVIAIRAIRVTAQPDDVRELRTALQSKNRDLRIAAIEGLAAAIGRDARPDLEMYLKDPLQDEQPSLAAARALAGFGESDSLFVLLKLLSSRDVNVRQKSLVILRSVTGQNFRYSSYLPEEKRMQALAEWQAWINQNGRTAKLRLPLRLYGAGESFLFGNTLLAFQGQNKVAEYDANFKEVWSHVVPSPWSAEKLMNGNYLISSQTLKKVIEVSPDKKIVWEFQSQFPFRARQLENENILIADYAAKKIIEVDRDKQVVWQHSAPSHCTDAHRLPSGNTMYSAYGKNIVEVTPKGKTVWGYSITGVFGFQPLRNENVLFCEYNKNRVVEITRGKKVIWEYTIANPMDVFRLSNGNTLISSRTQFIEVTPDKKIVWKKTSGGFGTARR